MTLLVFELSDTPGAALFSEAAPETLRYLVGQGFYGELVDVALWPLLEFHAGPALMMDYDPAQAGSEELARAAGTKGLSYLHFRLAGDALAALDAALGALSEGLGDEDTVAILAVARPDLPQSSQSSQRGEPPAGTFLIVSRASPLAGFVGRATAADLALTLLALSGIARPAGLSGQALISGPAAPLDDDDEAALRERFRGLGYVA